MFKAWANALNLLGNDMKSRAIVSDTQGGFTLETLEVAEPGPGEVRVEIKASGVCHTDYDSMRWPDRQVMGHEGAGVVQTVGREVSVFAPGDRVLLNWAVPCGACFQCALGNQAICEINSPVTGGAGRQGHAHPSTTTLGGMPLLRAFHLGTMSQYTVVKQEALVKIEVEVPFESACIVGCGVMTGYGSVVNAAQVQPGSVCVVLGAGGVGLNVIQGCRMSGAERVIAVDVNEHRLELSRQFGATDVVQAHRDDRGLLSVADQVKAMTQGRGADYAFECTAIPQLGAAPLAMIRHGGVAVAVSGIEQEVAIDMSLFEWDKVYINPLYGQCRPQIDLPRLLRLYAKGDLLLDELVSKTYSLDELSQAFDDMHHGRIAKGVIVMEA